MLAVLGVMLIGGAFAPGVVAADSEYVLALDRQPSGQLDIDVNVSEGDAAWWTSPISIAIGVFARVLLVVIIAMAARSGGTRVIKD